MMVRGLEIQLNSSHTVVKDVSPGQKRLNCWDRFPSKFGALFRKKKLVLVENDLSFERKLPILSLKV